VRVRRQSRAQLGSQSLYNSKRSNRRLDISERHCCPKTEHRPTQTQAGLRDARHASISFLKVNTKALNGLLIISRQIGAIV